MNRYITISLIFLAISVVIQAQTKLDSIISEVERNNYTLKVINKEIIAAKTGNKTGIFLDNPEVGFNYLWGSPSDIGKRKDFSATQSFDFATIFGYKRSVANEQNNLLDWEYKARRQEILLGVKYLYIDIVYYNALLDELNLRQKYAELICSGVKERLDKGDANILEYNNAKINLAKTNGDILKANTEREVLFTILTGLNNGIRPEIKDIEISIDSLPDNFNDWIIYAGQNSPVLAHVRQQIELSQKQVSLSKALWIPKISAGFMSEDVVGELYLGITLGMSVPLWENKNKIKYAKAELIAADMKAKDAKFKFYNQLETMFLRASGLKQTLSIYKESLSGANNTILLKKALDAGQISILEYVMEMNLYFDILTQSLESEREYQKSLAELSAFEL